MSRSARQRGRASSVSSVVAGWFPSPGFANLYGIVVLAILLVDEFMPRLMGSKGTLRGRSQDRSSFLAIYACSVGGLAAALYLRYRNVGVVPAWAQAAALLVLIGGGILLEWAVYLLGKHFSRTVMITSDQRLITAGPYRLLRHPAYTGMIIMDAAIVLGLGTWVGALVMLIVMLLPTLYRIRVEERVLESAFGEQYLDWARRTWRLFPGW